MLDSLPDYSVLKQVFESWQQEAPKVLQPSNRRNLQHKVLSKSDCITYASTFIELSWGQKSLKKYSQEQVLELAPMAFNCIYSLINDREEIFRTIKKHQVYIIDLIGTKKFELALGQLSSVSRILRKLVGIDADIEIRDTFVLSCIPKSSNFEDDPQLVSIIIAYYFLAFQSWLQYVIANLKVISQNKHPVLNFSLFIKIASALDSSGEFSKWMKHCYTENVGKKEKHFQNQLKIISGFIKTLTFLKTKIDNIELKTSLSAFEIKLIELQCISQQEISLNLLEKIELNHFTITFIKNLQLVSKDSSMAKRLDDLLNSQETLPSSINLIDTIETASSRPNINTMRQLSTALLSSPPSPSLFKDSYFLSSFKSLNERITQYHSDFAITYYSLIIDFITQGFLELESISKQHLQVLDPITIFIRNSIDYFEKDSFPLISKFLNNQYLVFAKFGDLKRVRNLSHLYFNLGKRNHSFDYWEKSFEYEVFIYTYGKDTQTDENLSILQDKLGKILNTLNDDNKPKDCCVIISTFLSIYEKAKNVPNEKVVSAVNLFDMPLIIQLIVKCLVSDKSCLVYLIGNSSLLSDNMKAVLFIKICQFLEKSNSVSQKTLIINELARDLYLSQLDATIICNYHYYILNGVQYEMSDVRGPDTQVLLFKGGIELQKLVHSTSFKSSEIYICVGLFKKWLEVSAESEILLYRDYEFEILKSFVAFLNFNQMYDELIEFCDFYKANRNFEGVWFQRVKLFLDIESCDASLRLGLIDQAQEYLRASGTLLKYLSNYTTNDRKLTKISNQDIVHWKLLQINCSILMNNHEQSVQRFKSITKFLESKSEFNLKEHVPGITIENRFINMILLAKLHISTCNLLIQSNQYIESFIGCKMALKILHSVVKKLPNNIPKDFYNHMKWKAADLLFQCYELILCVMKHLGITRDFSYYIGEITNLNSSISAPFSKCINNYFAAKNQIIIHEFEDASIELKKASSNIQLLNENYLKAPEAQLNIMYKELTGKLAVLNDTLDSWNLSDLTKLLHNDSLKSSLAYLSVTKFPVLDSAYILSLKGKGQIEVLDEDVSEDKHRSVIKILMKVKRELFICQLLLSSLPLMSTFLDTPSSIPCMSTKFGTKADSDTVSTIVDKLIQTKLILFKSAQRGYLEFLDNHELHDFGKCLSLCLSHLSLIRELKPSSTSHLTRTLLYLQDLPRQYPFSNDKRAYAMDAEAIIGTNELLPKFCPLPIETDNIDESADVFISELISFLPKNWSVITLDICPLNGDLLISKVTTSSSIPFFLRLPLLRFNSRNFKNINFSFGDLEVEFKRIIEQSALSTKFSTTSQIKSKEDRRKWWKLRFGLDMNLKNMLDIVDKHWIGGFRGIFTANDMSENEIFTNFIRDLNNIWQDTLSVASINSFEIGSTVAYFFYNLAQDIDDFCEFASPDLDDLIHFVLETNNYHHQINIFDLVNIDQLRSSLLELLKSYSSTKAAIKACQMSDKEEHIVLIPSFKCNFFPWESLECMRDRSVSRMPSISSTIQLLKSKKSLKVYSENKNELFYLINPGGDLTRTENKFKPLFQSIDNSNGMFGVKPQEENFLEGLLTSDLFVYLGHGGCEQYVRPSSLLKTVNSSPSQKLPPSLLVGCSSGKLHSNGFLEPNGNVYDWLICGSPMILVNLWDVTDKDIDSFSSSVFEKWGLFSSSRTDFSISEAVSASRDECTLKYLNGSAPIVYGLPLKIR